MKFSYISKSTVFLLATIGMVLFLIGAWFLFLLWLIAVSISFYIFRKKKVYFLDDQVTTSGTIYAPINGVVTGVSEDTVTVTCGPLNEYGIFMPFTCEVIDVQYHTDQRKDLFTQKKKQVGTSVELELQDKKERILKLEFLKLMYSQLPELVVLPGDRGRRQVNIGFMPFGGRVNISIPSANEIVVKPGERIRSSETIIARFLDDEN